DLLRTVTLARQIVERGNTVFADGQLSRTARAHAESTRLVDEYRTAALKQQLDSRQALRNVTGVTRMKEEDLPAVGVDEKPAVKPRSILRAEEHLVIFVGVVVAQRVDVPLAEVGVEHLIPVETG